MSITSVLAPVQLFDLNGLPYTFQDWIRQLGNYLDNGVYTPVLTSLVNVASSVASPLQFLRVGKTVTVSGQLDLTPTVNSVITALFITIPIPTVFAISGQCAGTAVDQGAGVSAVVRNVVSGQSVILAIPTGVVGLSTFSLHFTYRIT